MSALVSILEIGLAISDLFLTYYNIYGPCYTHPCSLYQDAIYVSTLSVLLILIIEPLNCIHFSIVPGACLFSGAEWIAAICLKRE